ncbi:MAG: copper resistance protein CopC [Acidimicrobiales bacterium]|nr:copper resistance protein CopC [Acidimicrobiales bacterium]
MRGRGGRRRAAAARAVVALVLVVLGVVAGAGAAEAHAELTASTPADGARLATVPPRIQLGFSESVTVPADGVQVLDSRGRRVDAGKATVQGATVVVALRAGLGDDGYIVSWRVISADSHPVTGGISFVVGSGPAPSLDAVRAAGAGHDRSWQITGALLRIVMYAAGALLVGGVLFMVAVHPLDADPRLHTNLLAVAGVLTAAAGFGQLIVQAAVASGRGPLALFRGSAGEAVAQRFGWSIGLVMVASLWGVVLVLLAEGDRKVLGFVALPVVALIPLGFAVAGHPTTGRGAGWTSLADLAHASAACAWVGGLVLLIPSWRTHRDSDDPHAAGVLVRRFSAVATVSVLTVLGAGLVLAWRETTWSTLLPTTYGRLLLAKVGLALALSALGAYNHFGLVPRIGADGADHPRAWRRLNHTLRFEAATFAAVLALTGVLVNVTPAKNHRPTRPAAAPVAVLKPVPLGPLSLQVNVQPARPGRAQVDLTITAADGSPSTLPPDRITVEYRLPSAGLGPLQRPVVLVGPGRYRADGSAMGVAGQWRITVRARTGRFDEGTATVTTTLA